MCRISSLFEHWKLWHNKARLRLIPRAPGSDESDCGWQSLQSVQVGQIGQISIQQERASDQIRRYLSRSSADWWIWWDSSTPMRTTDTVWEWPTETKSRRTCLVCITMGRWFAWFALPTLLCKEIGGLQPWLGDECIDGLLQARAWRNAEKYSDWSRVA